MSRQLKILVPGGTHIVDLVGQRDELLRLIEAEFSSDILVRGNEITITGPNEDAERAATVFEELLKLLQNGQVLTVESVGHAVRMVKTDGGPRPSDVMTDTIVTTRGHVIRPKTSGQKRYVDAIRKSTLVFGIGPAGTGKTYLAVAMAVKALHDKEIDRIILTRPAVEAGERLGFLPGDIAQKVDPYLKPLYDALYEMLEPGNYARLAERGTIEVAPLAYMRGRAQPYYSRVLTPTGFVPIGALGPGDLVIGTDGNATRVLGVYPQGRKEIFRIRTQDGASTLCCGEHLWSVRTRDDRRRGRGPRVLETREMVGRLRSSHYHRYELPLLTSPVAFPVRDTPMDPYALGLLLGDGCLTGSTTPSVSTADSELAFALEAALDGIDVRRKGQVEYMLRNAAGGRGGLRIANPVTMTLRDLELCGTRSSTKFVPEVYLYNAADVRLAVLQGLLDSDGGPVTQRVRSCRIQHVTTSQRLADDVVFLVRSLGGVAYRRTRQALGREPGRARGGAVPYNADAYVIDIRLPHGVEPFRLSRKREAYERHGGGRPMRFIDVIEPAGEEDTVCIRVEATDSLYVTDDFLVTHNTLNDSFIILDEAQNTTPEQMKMFLTRLGLRSQAVVTGDITQIDLPEGQRSGLVVVQEILRGIGKLEFVYLEASDVVRHRIVQEIVEAYRIYEDQRPKR